MDFSKSRHVRLSKSDACLLSGAAALVVSGMAFQANAQPSSPNLLQNPGFENPVDNSGNTSDSTITDWTSYGYGGADRGDFYNHTPGGQWSVWEQAFQPSGGIYQTV